IASRFLRPRPELSRRATREEVQLVHSSELLDNVHTVCTGQSGENFAGYRVFSDTFEAVYVNEHSERCALLAAGSAIELVDAVYLGTLDNGFAAIRPPGHHASYSESNGYCIYNNVAIAARHLTENRGAKR
ncbi:polyamine deacetylase HDAC10-like, partial [Paramacrobiotus metropolitanus]|uniref:polyamine deacetylase HDAC10-like n=1 Tax=Paramacrobiotus metropolitanus TaxID=2943436 RepID=UPI0024458D2F